MILFHSVVFSLTVVMCRLLSVMCQCLLCDEGTCTVSTSSCSSYLHACMFIHCVQIYLCTLFFALYLNYIVCAGYVQAFQMRAFPLLHVYYITFGVVVIVCTHVTIMIKQVFSYRYMY